MVVIIIIKYVKGGYTLVRSGIVTLKIKNTFMVLKVFCKYLPMTFVLLIMIHISLII